MKTKPMSSLATSSASVAAERKAALKRLIDAGRLDEIPEYQAQSALSDEDRQVLGRIHPAFMGGEYLSDLQENEVAIARLTIASTTQDVTSVYARCGKNRIRYRVVDEYDGDTLSGRNTRSSTRPLTLSELEAFFQRRMVALRRTEMNFGNDGYELDRMFRFAVGVKSEFYSQIGKLYERQIEAWAALRREALGLDKPEEELEPVVGAGPEPRHE